MRAYNAQQFVPFKWSGRNWAKRMGWTRKELDEELAAFYDRIFSRYAAKHGKERWGDKTPFHTWHVDDMARVFPEAAFIAIVRHPGGCVGSNMSRWGQSIRHATDHYRRYNMEIARVAAAHGDRFAVVRYEDLVLRPGAGPARAARLARRAVVGERARAPRRAGQPRRQAQGRGPQHGRRPDRRVADQQVDDADGRAPAGGAAAPPGAARPVLRLRRRRPGGADAAARGRADRGRRGPRRPDRASSPTSTCAASEPSRSPTASTTRARSRCAASRRSPSSSGQADRRAPAAPGRAGRLAADAVAGVQARVRPAGAAVRRR